MNQKRKQMCLEFKLEGLKLLKFEENAVDIGRNIGLTTITEMIAEIDKDNSGTVDFEEFIDMMRSRVGDSIPKEDIECAFNLFDKNKDDLISLEELHKNLNDLKIKISVQETEELIKLVDKDGDNKINFEDFSWMMENDPD